jgi:Ca2+:H+ antiporter
MPRWFYILLIFSIAAPLLALLPIPPFLLFLLAALGILPLAALIGTSIEHIAEHTGEQVGGILFATFGNATELIIGILALSKGLVDVVSASIIGSILGNVLLVLGVAICVGSVKHGRLSFDVRPASVYASLLALSIGGLLLPTVAELLATRAHEAQIFERGVALSDFIAVLLLLGYIASLLFSVFHVGDKGGDEELDPLLGARSATAVTRLLAFRQQLATSDVKGKNGMLRQIDGTVDAIIADEKGKQATTPSQEGGEQVAFPEGNLSKDGGEHTPSPDKSVSQAAPPRQEHKTSLWRALLLLAVATAGVAVLSEVLVGSIEPVTEALHWRPSFVGLVFIPLIGGLPEYFNTISMALDKRMNMVLAASAGSSIQIALLMAPILVLVSLVMPKRLDLVFSVVELAVLGLATFLFGEITKDGELVWLEGFLLILLYTMMGATIFLFGS